MIASSSIALLVDVVGVDADHDRAALFARDLRRLRAMSSRVAAASSPMFRWAVSMASATPRPHEYTERRKSSVASQSISAGCPGVLSAQIFGTTCAAA